MLEEIRIKTSRVHREQQQFGKDYDDIDQGQEKEEAEKGNLSPIYLRGRVRASLVAEW